MDKQRIVEIFYFDAGGGHRNAMNALSEVLADAPHEWIVKPINLQAILEPIDPIYRLTDRLSVIGDVLDEVKPKLSPVLQKFLEVIASKLTFRILQSDQFYNELLKRDRTSGMDILLPILQRLIKLASGKIQTLLKQHWKHVDYKPDMIISVIPNFNAVLHKSLKKVYPHTPYVTIMTDMVDVPPYFWMEKQDQFIICGTPVAHAQALATGFYRPEKVHLVSGMILKKCFYDADSLEEMPSLLSDLSTSPSTKTALVMFGGHGSFLSEQIVDQLNASHLDIQTIVMCGHNKALYEKLQSKRNCHPIPFVNNVAPYMRHADFFIGKPGPGSISEAVYLKCPLVVESNSATMPQERPNIDWILQNQIGVAVKDLETDVGEAVERMLLNLDTYQQNIDKLKTNQAVFEIADILNHIIETAHVSANENIPKPLKQNRFGRSLFSKNKRTR